MCFFNIHSTQVFARSDHSVPSLGQMQIKAHLSYMNNDVNYRQTIKNICTHCHRPTQVHSVGHFIEKYLSQGHLRSLILSDSQSNGEQSSGFPGNSEL